MTRFFLRVPLALAALALCAVASATTAATTDGAAGKACFLSNRWEGWSAPGDGDTLLLRVGLNEVFRVELTPGSHVRKTGDNFLISRVRGSSWICSPLDLDLELADHFGMRQGLIARSIHKLAPEEVAAIPRKDRP